MTCSGYGIVSMDAEYKRCVFPEYSFTLYGRGTDSLFKLWYHAYGRLSMKACVPKL